MEPAIRRWIGLGTVVIALNFVWEMAQAGLYTGMDNDLS